VQDLIVGAPRFTDYSFFRQTSLPLSIIPARPLHR
jgi:hypothetical protein